MEIVLLVILVVLAILSVFLLLQISRRKSEFNLEPIEKVLREEFRVAREESARQARELREELARAQKESTESMVKTIGEMGKAQNNSGESVVKTIGEMGKTQSESLENIAKRILTLTESNESRFDKVRTTIDSQLKHLQESNEKKLEEMRKTVDEKLQSTLEKRLGESFKLVSERLEAVQRGLGEMQNLATGVGDLKKVLTNVKTRGSFGEVQLEAILEQIMTPDQYEKNVQTKKGSQDMVEFAVKLPGTDDDPKSCVWLPIDAKFPQEDYLRLVEAADVADTDGIQKATASLVRSVQNSARTISEKYVDPPLTTDFAILFLPTEGLYAEILRQPGLIEDVQQKHRIVMAGPTTLSAILCSLRMGFQTLAIEKRSHEVWKVLAAVKTEFGKFGDVLTKVKRQLTTASNTIDETEVRTRAMERKLRDVEKLPTDSPVDLLELPEAGNGELFEKEEDSL